MNDKIWNRLEEVFVFKVDAVLVNGNRKTWVYIIDDFQWESKACWMIRKIYNMMIF